ncbi:putative oxidoreductase YteT [Zancudomyces culisetae]|uniref:Putative oxidoreductase YteT n=1 Tax=Zancudomyces culisetae TaxID=1213189 RepID=A0A1R1PK88_ZANCU|nr:putative oxidoreductase YteT [Zancudomyces culisetae]OMH85677.1 putative oxidoreductase YteT [Zancudomyces culisetae]|eukprot:OMH81349.1 putative oxidoreductase YteT [Zancudomyces culisetae]
MRGNIYATYAMSRPEKMRVVGVVDPDPVRRENMAKKHNIQAEHTLTSVDELVGMDKFADAVIISTLDQTHCNIAVAMANRKYNILLEKPMATSLQDCKDIYQATVDNGITLAVCHVMRYTPIYSEVMKLVNSGVLGEIYSVQHLEAIGNTHFSHSFVRGNWAKEEETSFSLMTKCIHDVDLINWFMGGAKCTKVSSFGHLSHFKKDKKPMEAGDAKTCMECAHESNCPYSAKTIYLEPTKRGESGFPMNAITNVIDIENITKAITSGPYGRCVYECDNNVCDNQVVTFEFEGNKTATLTMIAFTEDLCIRKTKIYGSKGELITDGIGEITVFDFATCKKTVVHPHEMEQYKVYSDLFGHGGGDYGIISSFIDSLIYNDPSLNKSGAYESLLSHMYTFAAEDSRVKGCVVTPDTS